MNKLSVIDWVSLVLVIIGGINWGLVGIMDTDLVNSIFGVGMLSIIVYDLVGLAAIYLLISLPKLARK